MKSQCTQVLIILLISVSLLLLACGSPSSANTNLHNWRNKETRQELLPELLVDVPSKPVKETPLDKRSPVYGLSVQQVVALLGPPDTRYPQKLKYKIGNLTANPLESLFVSQDATLTLLFGNSGCESYMIIT